MQTCLHCRELSHIEVAELDIAASVNLCRTAGVESNSGLLPPEDVDVLRLVEVLLFGGRFRSQRSLLLLLDIGIVGLNAGDPRQVDALGLSDSLRCSGRL